LKINEIFSAPQIEQIVSQICADYHSNSGIPRLNRRDQRELLKRFYFRTQIFEIAIINHAVNIRNQNGQCDEVYGSFA